jgi:hypothetical protein
MSDKILRAKIIRLAHQNPELRKHLLPLVTKTGNLDRRDTENAIKDAMRGSTEWNIDGNYDLKWKKHSVILKSHIEFVIEGDVSGVHSERDFGMGQRYLLVPDNKGQAQKECEDHAHSTLEKAFKDEGVAVQVANIRSRIHFDAESGNGACSLEIEISKS